MGIAVMLNKNLSSDEDSFTSHWNEVCYHEDARGTCAAADNQHVDKPAHLLVQSDLQCCTHKCYSVEREKHQEIDE